MSYSASAELFYGVVVPHNADVGDLDEDEVNDAGYCLVTYGNFLSGDVGQGIAMIAYRTGECECKSFDPTIPEETEIQEFKEYLKTLGLEKEKIGWYNTVSYS